MLVVASMLEAALAYAELGYAVFPCVPNGKVPLTEHGLSDATTDATRIENWWHARSDANIAIATNGLLVVDVDGADNPWMTPERELSLAVGPVQNTPRGGSHFWFRLPVGVDLRNTTSRIADRVDTRANGGYVLVAPSRVDDKPYAWRPDLELAVTPEGLPEPPAWLLEILLATPAPSIASPGQANAIPEGQRNQTLAKLGGSMRRVGMSRTEILAALSVANAERCHPPLPASEVDTIAGSVARYEPSQVWTALTEGWADQDAGAIEPDPLAPDDPGPFPKDLLEVPGFVADVMQHNMATAHRQQPVLALAAALSLQASLAARKVRDQRGNRTNSYHIGVAPSGDGKDHARKLNRRILIESRMDIEGPEELASDAGLVAAVAQCPGLLLQIDEIGRFLRTVAEPGKNPHLYNVQTVLMKLYSQADSTFLGKAYADVKKRQPIVQPCVCIYGTTVPEHLFASLTPETMSDGFIARVLIFEGEANPPRRESAEAPLPIGIVERAKWWSQFRASSLAGISSVPPDPQLVTHEPGAVEVFRDLAAIADEQRMRLEGPARSIWARVEEKACRLALIYICSADPERMVVTREAAAWACRLAEFLTRRVLFLAHRYVAENVFDAKRKRVLRAIEDAGAKGLDGHGLCRRTRAMLVRERADIIEALKSTGEISEELIPTGGRPRMHLVASRFRQANGGAA